jgi:thiol-disulfide isomerase/thioredoxin
MEGLLVLVAALAAATALGLWLHRSGRRLAAAPTSAPAEVTLAAADLGSDLGERATLVQFSTAFCQPCRATRRVLDDVSRTVPGVRHVEIDAESHLDLVRRLDVRRTPTVLVLDGQGRVVRRASGQPRPADVIAALGAAVGG